MDKETMIELFKENNVKLADMMDEKIKDNNVILADMMDEKIKENNVKLADMMDEKIKENNVKLADMMDEKIEANNVKLFKRFDALEEKIIHNAFYFEETYGKKIDIIFEKLQLNDELKSVQDKELEKNLKHNENLLLSHEVRITNLEKAVNS